MFGYVRINRVSNDSSTFVKLCFKTLTVEWKLVLAKRSYNWSLVKRWLLISKVTGLGTKSKMSGKSLSSIYFL